MKLTEHQQETINTLAVNFSSRPKINTVLKGIKVSFFVNSRIENLKCVKFVHSFYIDKNGCIYDKQIKIKKVSK